ncbi:hypothetical protein THAOC_03366 [Thalassiosira oceanica]|uniref:Uncharacterized protein n=1 Tax=Thalassiosira oceanica TaxID=159749 RepID=K0TBP9_THAOC|nr:hypothetical protein THAOC_03366 [Thalassiosira oceanica]|eukprot:EJK74930.1 hypothetical protein THAOC_03366 [Thalassiosira oceanica]
MFKAAASVVQTPRRIVQFFRTPKATETPGPRRVDEPSTPPHGYSSPPPGTTTPGGGSGKHAIATCRPTSTWATHQSSRYGSEQRERLLKKHDGKSYQLVEKNHDEFVKHMEETFEAGGLGSIWEVPKWSGGGILRRGDASTNNLLETYKTKGGATLDDVQAMIIRQSGGDPEQDAVGPDETYTIKIEDSLLSLDNDVGREAQQNYQSHCVDQLVTDSLNKLFGRDTIKHLVSSASYSVTAIETATGDRLTIGRLLLCLVLDEMRAPALTIVDRHMKAYNKLSIKDVDDENPGILRGKIIKAAELVNSTAGKTKLDEDDILARFKDACLHATNVEFVKAVESRWTKYEQNKYSRAEFYSKLRSDFRQISNSVVQGDKTYAMVTKDNENLRKKVFALEKRVKNGERSKDQGSKDQDSKDKGTQKPGFDPHGFNLRLKTDDHIKHPKTGLTMTWIEKGDGRKHSRYYAQGLIPKEAWFKMSEEEKKAASPKYRGADSKKENAGGKNRRDKRSRPPTPTSDKPASSAKKTPTRMQVKHSFVTRAVCSEGMSEDDAAACFDKSIWPVDHDDATADDSSKD